MTRVAVTSAPMNTGSKRRLPRRLSLSHTVTIKKRVKKVSSRQMVKVSSIKTVNQAQTTMKKLVDRGSTRMTSESSS